MAGTLRLPAAVARRTLAPWLVATVLAGLLPPAAHAAIRRSQLEPGVHAVLADGERLYVEATPRAGEGLIVFARRLCDTSSAAAAISEANGRVRQLKTGLRYRVPYELLSPENQLRVVHALFRADRAEAAGWRHSPQAQVGLWHVAKWFTGRGENFAAIRSHNQFRDDTVDAGQSVIIPARLLLPAFRVEVFAREAGGAVKAIPAPPALSAPTPAERPAGSTGPHVEPQTATVTAPATAALAVPAPMTPQPLDPEPSDGTDLEEVAETPAESAVPQPQPSLPQIRLAPMAPPTGTAGVSDAPSSSSPSAATAPAPALTVAKPAQSLNASGGRAPVTAGVSSIAALLRYGRDSAGDYAIYPLQGGEALYSSVVVRFTGRIYAEDVNGLAAEIAERSGIRDVTDIPIGFPVKIALEHLQPEFLPPGHPRRVEYEAGLQASEAYRQRFQVAGLEGVTLILDAGHGGRDVGAMVEGVREATYVYDIAVRVKRLLETYTRARVVMTTRDGQDHVLQDADVLRASGGHAVLTTPPYPIADSKVGVHLRWFLANSVFRRAARKEADAERMVFLSLHADSLHPTIRGAMAYIPDPHSTVTRGPFSGPEYAARREVREQPRGNASRAELQKSAGLSRQFAEELIEAFRDEELAIHPFKPIRDRIVRGKRPWVPAVLKYNSVPARVLFEVCNLNNPQDRTLLQTRAYRQKVAEAVVKALSAYYTPQTSGRGGSAVASKR